MTTPSDATSPAPDPRALPPLPEQAERLVDLGVHTVAGIDPAELRALAGDAPRHGLLVVDDDRAPVSALAPLLRLGDRSGFVVTDMTDVDRFRPLEALTIPPGPVYVVEEPDRGDDLADVSPTEALPTLTAAGRSPLTLAEGVHWLLQRPAVLERNHCFMTIGSRLVADARRSRLDSRTPALWISNGTGRDGPARRGAPKVGWCWANNRHTWLGIASTTARHPVTP